VVHAPPRLVETPPHRKQSWHIIAAEDWQIRGLFSAIVGGLIGAAVLPLLGLAIVLRFAYELRHGPRARRL
jgi:hypothetical protein